MNGQPFRMSTVSWTTRWAVAALAVALCSCQTVRSPMTRPASGVTEPSDARPATLPMAGPASSAAAPAAQVAYLPPALPPNATTGAPYVEPAVSSGYPGDWCWPPAAEAVAAEAGGVPYDPAWRPPQIPGPWPRDEYLFDGGDRGTQVDVLRDWTVRGLDAEDTVAHYDTLEGRTEVQAANRVAIYAPRFAAVRKVYGFVAHQQASRAAGVETPTMLQVREERRAASTMDQPLQPGRYVAAASPLRFREAVRSGGVDGRDVLAGLTNRFAVYENFEIIRSGTFDNSEKARLAERLSAALVWSSHQAVQAVIDNVTASVAVNHVGLQSVYHYETPPGKPRLRVVKVASQRQAQPGETVEFTIRFDNIGDQLIGNVTIVDSLTTRLEYVPDTAQCTRPGKFLTQENEGESLVLRWELSDPLPVGEGGIIRFQCRVR
jgi:uncharacterized repeat protein (TIGR01451 family)